MNDDEMKTAAIKRALLLHECLERAWERDDMDPEGPWFVDIPATVMLLVSMARASGMSQAVLLEGVSAFYQDCVKAASDE